MAPAPALAIDSRLTAAARRHSGDMASNNTFSHTGTDGSSVGQRVTAAGYAWGSVAENIAGGQTDTAEVVRAWVASSGHCMNLMAPSLQHAGLACVAGGSSAAYRTYWTLDLGRSR